MKKIGIDARFYAQAGPGRYVKNIISQLELLDTGNEYYIFLQKKGFDLYKPSNKNFKKVLANYSWYSFDEQIRFLFKAVSLKLDIFYVPHFNIPVLYPFTLITAIPDIIMHTFSTEKGTTLPKFYFKFKKFIYKLVVFWAVWRSKKVIVPSTDVINDFVTVYPSIKKSKYVLAYEGVDPDLLKDPNVLKEPFKKLKLEFDLSSNFLLYVSSMYEHKNIFNLIDAFELLINKYSYIGQLVLVGKKDKFSLEAFEYIKSKNLQNKILMPGLKRFITDEEVCALRLNAQLYVFPSLKEGFSLTPLESMVYNLPCVISNIPCHKEVYKDASVFFDPFNITDIAKKINLVLQDKNLQKSLSLKGKNLVKTYNWKDTAQITLNVFQNYLK